MNKVVKPAVIAAVVSLFSFSAMAYDRDVSDPQVCGLAAAGNMTSHSDTMKGIKSTTTGDRLPILGIMKT
jgi:hypothetical protein